MRVSFYINISMKDKPPGYRGITGESWTVGKEKEVRPTEGVASLFAILDRFYGECYSSEQMVEELQKMAQFFEQEAHRRKEEQE